MTAGLIFFVVSAASAFATLTTFAAVLHGRPLHTWPLAARVMLVLALLGLSVVSGRAWYETTQHKPTEPPRKQRPASSAVKEPLPVTLASSVSATSTATLPRSTSRPLEPSTPTRHDQITVREQDGSLPDVAAAADDALNMLRSQFYTVRGHLRCTQSHPDERLQGLITTDLTLDVTLRDAHGAVHDTVTVSGRGGGFTSEASALQARQRLRDALQQYLQKEHS